MSEEVAPVEDDSTYFEVGCWEWDRGEYEVTLKYWIAGPNIFQIDTRWKMGTLDQAVSFMEQLLNAWHVGGLMAVTAFLESRQPISSLDE